MLATVFTRDHRGITIIEVMVAAVLIMVGLGSILAINARSLSILRATRQTSAASQVLQQRLEGLRGRLWPEISNGTALAALLQTPTESEKELTDPAFSETLTVSVPETSGGAVSSEQSFSVRRLRGNVLILDDGDLGKATTLLFEDFISWRDAQGVHERQLRTIVCRAGLTRNGIFGSPLGRFGGSLSHP